MVVPELSVLVAQVRQLSSRDAVDSEVARNSDRSLNSHCSSYFSCLVNPCAPPRTSAQVTVAPLTTMAEERRRLREVEQCNMALQQKVREFASVLSTHDRQVNELHARLCHRDQMLDYTLAAPPQGDLMILCVLKQTIDNAQASPPKHDTVQPPAPSVVPAQQDELLDFFANVLSPRK
jgi:hypothetical protein